MIIYAILLHSPTLYSFLYIPLMKTIITPNKCPSGIRVVGNGINMVWLRRHWGVAGFWTIKRQKRPYQHTRFIH